MLRLLGKQRKCVAEKDNSKDDRKNIVSIKDKQNVE